jgi:cytidyltransferase-like protein
MQKTQALIDKKRAAGANIVLATGVFDILHIEHIRFLTRAKAAGDFLSVGLETDARVKSMKGHHRPVNDQIVRLEQISSLKPVDHAFILPEKFSTQSDWDHFMAAVSPVVYAVSSHTKYLENKRKLAKKHGSTLKVVHEFNPTFSTTKFYHRLLEEI